MIEAVPTKGDAMSIAGIRDFIGVSERLATGGQPSEEEIRALAEAGFIATGMPRSSRSRQAGTDERLRDRRSDDAQRTWGGPQDPCATTTCHRQCQLACEPIPSLVLKT